MILSSSMDELSPQQLAELDARNLALGLAMSKSSSLSSSPIPAATSASTSTPSSSSGSSHPRQLVPFVPVGKTPSKPTAPAKQPKKTTQMSATWMRQYKDDTAADALKLNRAKYIGSLDLSRGRTLIAVHWKSVRNYYIFSQLHI
jgi:hypothetical protein